MSRDFARIGIVGLGTVGSGLAEVFTRAGLDVVGVDTDEAARARATVPASAGLDVLADVDLVIEAVPERLAVKRQVFADLGAVVRPDTVLATTTCALSVTELAVAATHPHRVLGLHFAAPVESRALIEVVRTVFTAPDVLDDARAFVTGRLGRNELVVGDRPGLITSALKFAYLNQAVSFVESGYATRDDVDAAMRLGCGLAVGPLRVVDQIGLDNTYDVLTALYERSGDRRHAPSPLLKQMIAGGLLGVKSGRGFYTYADGEPVLDARDGTAKTAVRAVRTVGVVGSGTMATGIVEVFAKAGFDVVFVTRGRPQCDRVLAALTKSLDRAVSKGKLSQADRDSALGRVTGSATHDDLADVDLVVEAVVEDLAVKRALFATLDAVCKPGAVLATTTSSLPVIECASATKRPQDVVGLHFFNPAQVMKLVEIVSTVATGADVVATAHAVAGALGKHPVDCRDRAGFIVNALLFPYLNDAVSMLDAHYADADEIDTAVTLGFGYPMGPFALLDVVGLDVSLAIQKELHAEFHEPGFEPAPLLEHLVAAGYLGRKTSRGFRDHAR